MSLFPRIGSTGTLLVGLGVVSVVGTLFSAAGRPVGAWALLVRALSILFAVLSATAIGYVLGATWRGRWGLTLDGPLVGASLLAVVTLAVALLSTGPRIAVFVFVPPVGFLYEQRSSHVGTAIFGAITVLQVLGVLADHAWWASEFRWVIAATAVALGLLLIELWSLHHLEETLAAWNQSGDRGPTVDAGLGHAGNLPVLWSDAPPSPPENSFVLDKARGRAWYLAAAGLAGAVGVGLVHELWIGRGVSPWADQRVLLGAGAVIALALLVLQVLSRHREATGAKRS